MRFLSKIFINDLQIQNFNNTKLKGKLDNNTI